ncbi:DExH-box splicing factor binding site-domain-containing protein [Gaertneriomyces semiglobifer]|nr:DExH-box splicing factor binding site-domain-containing protein [Gaertneriomyces semiglobifer]
MSLQEQESWSGSGTPAETGSASGIKLSLGSSKLKAVPRRNGTGAFDSFEGRTAEKGPEDQLIEDLSGLSNAKKQKAPLVIPLIAANEWRANEGSQPLQTRYTELLESRLATSRSQSPAIPVVAVPPDTTSPPAETPSNDFIATDSSRTETSAGSDESKWGLQVPKRRKAAVAAIPVTHPDPATTPAHVDTQPHLNIEEEAAAAVLKEASGAYEKDGPKVTVLPILAQNAVPGLEQIEDVTEKYRHDVSLRPDVSSMDDYERVPIEDFGAALLRGMGWSEGKPVGKNPKGLIEPKQPQSRPHLLGLGATPAPVEVKKKKYYKPGEKRPQENTELPVTSTGGAGRSGRDRSPPRHSPSPNPTASLRVGSTVRITAGSNATRTGTITKIKDRSSGTVAYVDIGRDEEVKVWLDDLVPLLRGKDTDRTSIVTPTPRRGEKRDSDGERVVSRSGSAESQGSRSSERDSHVGKRSGISQSSWLRPHLRVRIISKSVGSRYYNMKAVIVDVPASGIGILRLENGELLENVKQRHLETYIPKLLGSVMVVSHEDPELLGQLGTVQARDDRRERVMIQIEQTLEVLEFSFDSVCEYVE